MIKIVILKLIMFYRKIISPMLPATCRFYPTCSQYAYEAVQRYGVLKGGKMAVKRILKCHPFNDGGYDPVK
ncbi:MAG: membrane protein insertion efficiency factor YidD [Mahellales bacterium]|jgi:putative membrane protein insertion efficiency factor